MWQWGNGSLVQASEHKMSTMDQTSVETSVIGSWKEVRKVTIGMGALVQMVFKD